MSEREKSGNEGSGRAGEPVQGASWAAQLAVSAAVGLIAIAAGQVGMGVVYAQESDDLDFLTEDESEDAATQDPLAEGASEEAGDNSQGDETADTIPVDPLVAEEEDLPEPTRQRAGSRVLEELVVTAQRRERDMSDVPISLQAFGGDALDALGISDLNKVQNIVPTLNVGTSANFTTVFLRGIGTDAFLTGDPSIAYYIDGIYFPFTFRLAQNFGKIERVEVLKGPQGTTFGRNAVGGAVHVITESPKFDEFYGEAQVGYGRFDSLKTRVHANIPITDTFAANATVFYEEKDTYENFVFGGVANDEQDKDEGIRVQLRWQPTDWLDMTLAGFRIDGEGPSGRALGNQAPSVAGLAIGADAQTGRDVNLSFPIESEITNEVFYADFKVKTDPMDIVLRGSTQDVPTFSKFDFDGSPAPGPGFAQVQFGDFQSAELQFISNDTSWGSERLEWVGGLYYFTGVQGFQPIRFNASSAIDPTSALGDPLAVNSPEGITELLNGIGISFPNGVINQDSLIGTDALAIYGEFSFKLTDWMGITLGGRYQEEEREILVITSFAELSDGSKGPELFDSSDRANTTEGDPVPPKNTDRAFSPKVALDFSPLSEDFGIFGSDALIYVSYQEATKAATYNPLAVLATAIFVESEELESYEIGFKGSLFDGLMTLDAAAFQYDVKNMQTQFIALTFGGATSLQNIPEARVRGFDFNFTSQLVPDLIDDLILTAGFGYLDTEYLDFSNARGFDPTTGVFRTDIDATGRNVAYSPDATVTATLTKTWQLFGNPLETGVDFYYSDGFFVTSDNNPNFVAESRELIGARVSYYYEPWRVRATLFGENLTDELYVTGCICNDFGFVRNLGSPRLVGLRLDVDF